MSAHLLRGQLRCEDPVERTSACMWENIAQGMKSLIAERDTRRGLSKVLVYWKQSPDLFIVNTAFEKKMELLVIYWRGGRQSQIYYVLVRMGDTQEGGERFASGSRLSSGVSTSSGSDGSGIEKVNNC